MEGNSRRRRAASKSNRHQFISLEPRLVLNAGSFLAGEAVNLKPDVVVETSTEMKHVEEKIDVNPFQTNEKSETIRPVVQEKIVGEEKVRIATVEPAEKPVAQDVDVVIADPQLESELDREAIDPFHGFGGGGDIILGDVNRDGVVDLLDVQPFRDVLDSEGMQEEADINGDGIVDDVDVPLFVNIIRYGTPDPFSDS